LRVDLVSCCSRIGVCNEFIVFLRWLLLEIACKAMMGRGIFETRRSLLDNANKKCDTYIWYTRSNNEWDLSRCILHVAVAGAHFNFSEFARAARRRKSSWSSILARMLNAFDNQLLLLSCFSREKYYLAAANTNSLAMAISLVLNSL
jgi:hypothetical protein